MIRGLIWTLTNNQGFRYVPPLYTLNAFCETNIADVSSLYNKRYPSHNADENERLANETLKNIFINASNEIARERVRDTLVVFSAAPLIAMKAATSLSSTINNPTDTIGAGVLIAFSTYYFWSAIKKMNLYNMKQIEDSSKDPKDETSKPHANDPFIFSRAEHMLKGYLLHNKL